MRFVLCDDDRLYTGIIEVMLSNLCHEVVGVAQTAADATALVGAARPDVVIVDLSVGFYGDFNVLEAALNVGATPIVFSQHADHAILSKYNPRPAVIYKPDLTTLEQVVGRLGLPSVQEVAQPDRRRRPVRSASGPVPTTISDPQSFYGALEEASPGDALVAIALPEPDGAVEQASVVAVRVRAILRSTDRILMSPRMIRVFLAGGEGDGVDSFRLRLVEAQAFPPGAALTSVVIASDESPADAFERLKAAPPC